MGPPERPPDPGALHDGRPRVVGRSMERRARPRSDRRGGRPGRFVMAGPRALDPSPRAFALDLEGTVYLGDSLLPGGAEAVAPLGAENRRVVFLTNKPLERGVDYAEKLSGLGIPTDAAD